MKGVDTKVFADEAYIREMTSTRTWGTAVEIQAICNVYSVRTVVRSTRADDSGQTFVFSPTSSMYTQVAYVSWDGGHYQECDPFLYVS